MTKRLSVLLTDLANKSFQPGNPTLEDLYDTTVAAKMFFLMQPTTTHLKTTLNGTPIPYDQFEDAKKSLYEFVESYYFSYDTKRSVLKQEYIDPLIDFLKRIEDKQILPRVGLTDIASYLDLLLLDHQNISMYQFKRIQLHLVDVLSELAN